MLPDAIEELYRVHRDVPLDPDVSYCDHCLGPDDVEELRRTPLRELSADATRLLLFAESDLPLRPYLDDWSAAGSVAAARHLADYLAGGVVIGMPERNAWLTSGAASAVISAAPPQTTDQAELLDTLVILDCWENHFDE